jgi:hypothetical protein
MYEQSKLLKTNHKSARYTRKSCFLPHAKPEKAILDVVSLKRPKELQSVATSLITRTTHAKYIVGNMA